MTTLNEKLKKLLSIEDETLLARSFEVFCRENFQELPLPGENRQFDEAIWAASQFLPLSAGDRKIAEKVTNRLIEQLKSVEVHSTQAGSSEAGNVTLKPSLLKETVFAIKDLVSQSKEAAIETWQNLLTCYSWQQMEPAGATRGLSSRLVSLGTFGQTVNEIKIQVNLGWLVDENNLRLLLQAKDQEENAVANVEVKLFEQERGEIFSRKTNQDGAMVAPSVRVEPGQYQIQVFMADKIMETPFFKI